jgi:hypothetical protein
MGRVNTMRLPDIRANSGSCPERVTTQRLGRLVPQRDRALGPPPPSVLFGFPFTISITHARPVDHPEGGVCSPPLSFPV